MNQLFQIDGETWKALGQDEVLATIEGMKECGICQLPYPKVDIRLPLDVCAHTSLRRDDPNANDKQLFSDETLIDKYLRLGLVVPHAEWEDRYSFRFGHDSWLDVKNLSLEDMNYQTVIYIGPHNPNFHKLQMHARETRYNDELERNLYAYALIVLLNTRNAVKTTKHRKCVGLGIGRKPGAYEYTTTITLPRVIEEDETGEAAPGGNGASKKPHLRRGHPRRQRFGPNWQFSEVRWIEPVFVNADPDWVDKRKAYNVSA